MEHSYTFLQCKMRVPCPPSTISTVVPTKSDSDIIFCLKLLSQILTCTPHLCLHKLIDRLCINPSDHKSLSKQNMTSLSHLAGRTVASQIDFLIPWTAIERGSDFKCLPGLIILS